LLLPSYLKEENLLKENLIVQIPPVHFEMLVLKELERRSDADQQAFAMDGVDQS
jgi:hypothetical protein